MKRMLYLYMALYYYIIKVLHIHILLFSMTKLLILERFVPICDNTIICLQKHRKELVSNAIA